MESIQTFKIPLSPYRNLEVRHEANGGTTVVIDINGTDKSYAILDSTQVCDLIKALK